MANAGSKSMEQHRENLQQKGAQIGKDLQETATEAKEAVRDQLEQVGEVAGEYIQRGRDEMMHMAESFEEQIRAQPIRSVMVAAGVGFLFGVLWLRH